MKPIYLILSIFLLFIFSLKAEEKIYERVYVHTDKDCYIAGEDVHLKFYVINKNFKPSILSKVGYLEICDTEKPQMQLKVALEKGHGAGKIRIPKDIPSGIYILSAYTRYMRNEGENVFFNKQIAIINANQQSADNKRFEVLEKYENNHSETFFNTEAKEPSNLLITTDEKEYGNRKKVFLSLNNIPENAADLVISVSRNDTIAHVQKINRHEWLKQVADTYNLSQQWIPEYEGHIITGRVIPESDNDLMLANISFVGKDIRYIMGQLNHQKGTVNFYTSEIYGNQQVVTSATSFFYDDLSNRIDLVSPFSESLPEILPVLNIYPNEKQLMDRYIGAQILDKTEKESFGNPSHAKGYYDFELVKTYDLDEYTRFESVAETILEFVNRLQVSRLRGKRIISAYLEETKLYSQRTLVLLDGIPIYNHEDILQYNPMYIKTINIYDGRYIFGNMNYECIVSFITRDTNLPNFQLNQASQLLDYECPQLPPAFELPDYSSEANQNSRKPDFRHTLYWNPFVEFTSSQPVNLSFYTSDLCGEFKVTVEGITTDGKLVYGDAYFNVVAPK